MNRVPRIPAPPPPDDSKPIADPLDFDPHEKGRKGFWIGAVGTALILGAIWLIGRL